MQELTTSTSLKLNEGYSEVKISTDEDIKLDIECDTKAVVYLVVEKAKSLTFNVQIKENANCTILVWNSTTSPLTTNEEWSVETNGTLKLAYGDCNDAAINRKSSINLVGDQADATIKSATLTSKQKHYELTCTSHVPHTYGVMENYCVVLKDGDYYMEATGSIKKGAFQSQSRQTSRALTMDEKQKSVILPKLLIDENDVQASHATSVGQMDENQMIYLQSRGLDVKQAMKLVSVGYLLPVANFIDNEELSNKLREEIESKVNETC